MGVYVPNKNKPKMCAMCPAYCLQTVPTFWDDPDALQRVEAHCVLLDKHIESIKEVRDDCPLIEIEEPKVGEWLPYTETTEVCSACGMGTQTRFFYKEFGMKASRHYYYNFCPNCGARMKGE